MLVAAAALELVGPEDVEWVAVTDLPHRLAYPNERRLAEAARLVLVGGA